LGIVYRLALGRDFPNAHRASADAKATLELYNSSWFQHRFNRQQDILSCSATLQDYWSRTMRLSGSREEVVSLGPYQQCVICQAIVSPYFKHLHE